MPSKNRQQVRERLEERQVLVQHFEHPQVTKEVFPCSAEPHRGAEDDVAGRLEGGTRGTDVHGSGQGA